MKLKPLVKFLSFTALAVIGSLRSVVAAQAQNPSVCVENTVSPCLPEIRLPDGCENYKLVKGDPHKSKVFLMGEAHVLCEEDRIKCTKGIIKTRKLKQASTAQAITLLFEEAPSGVRLDCEQISFAGVAKDCRGWNERYDALERNSYVLVKHVLLKSIIDDINRDINNNNNFKLTLSNLITSYSKAAENSYRLHVEAFKKMKASHPDITIDKFHSANLVMQFEHNKMSEYVSEMLEKNKKGKSAAKILRNLNKDYKKAIKDGQGIGTHQYHDFLRVPNQHLLSSIQSARKQKKLVFAYAGDSHFHIDNPNNIEAVKIVDELYAGLDEFADENPYSVLSCTR